MLQARNILAYTEHILVTHIIGQLCKDLEDGLFVQSPNRSNQPTPLNKCLNHAVLHKLTKDTNSQWGGGDDITMPTSLKMNNATAKTILQCITKCFFASTNLHQFRAAVQKVSFNVMVHREKQLADNVHPH